MPKYNFQLNGRPVSVESWDPAQPLLYVLRNALSLHGAKFGCGLAQCGACTVLIDGKAARSCNVREQCANREGYAGFLQLGEPSSFFIGVPRSLPQTTPLTTRRPCTMAG